MRRLLWIGLCLLMAGVSPAWAQGARYAVIVQGASGEPQYATQHRAWVDSLAAALRDKLGFDPSHISLLTEEPKANEVKGTAESVKATLDRLAKQTKADDLVFVMLIGHGSGDAASAKFNLVGPDLTNAEWSALIQPIPARLVIVDSTASSFPFLASLSSKNRIVITATNTYAQHFDTVFPEAFIQALTATDADADKDGRVSVLEAFMYASKLVDRHYEQVQYMSTEKALLDDNGDGKGRVAATTGDDGAIAALTFLDVVAAPKAADPAVQALLVRQQQLTEQIDDLRRRRPSMSADDFDKEFEKLIIDLATVSRDVRRKTGK